MIKNITIGQYIPGESFIHKLDPRTKILISILFIVNLFLVKNFTAYLFIFLFIMMMVRIARLSPKYLYKGIKPVFVLILFTAFLNMFVTRGTEETLLLEFWVFKIYREGVYQACLLYTSPSPRD